MHSANIIQSSQFVTCNEHQLHVRRIHTEDESKKRTPILMLHGSIENGRIFYTKSGKGLAGFLAKQGFDIFVADYRGRGESTPSVKEKNDHGYHSVTTEDIPTLVDYVYQQTHQACHVICHSWGGVMFASAYVRFPELQSKVKSMVKFGTKRQVSVMNIERLLKVDLFWKWFAPWYTKKAGYLDAKKMKVGADSEPRQALLESIEWVKKSVWVDPVDAFDYAEKAKSTDWPPTWHLTGVSDYSLGHQTDVKLFMDECSNAKAKFSLLSKQNGNALDYDHIDILTAPEAVNDHFPEVLAFLNEHD